MKKVACWYWMLPRNDDGTGKLERSRWRMSEDQAKAYVGAVKCAGEPKIRELPETAEEIDRARFGMWGRDLQGPSKSYYEAMAARYIAESGKTRHTSSCATSRAPAYKPGPCDCDAPQD